MRVLAGSFLAPRSVFTVPICMVSSVLFFFASLSYLCARMRRARSLLLLRGWGGVGEELARVRNTHNATLQPP